MSERRHNLIHSLRFSYSLERLAVMSDDELYLQWLHECEYPGGKDIIGEEDKSRGKTPKEG